MNQGYVFNECDKISSQYRDIDLGRPQRSTNPDSEERKRASVRRSHNRYAPLLTIWEVKSLTVHATEFFRRCVLALFMNFGLSKSRVSFNNAPPFEFSAPTVCSLAPSSVYQRTLDNTIAIGALISADTRIPSSALCSDRL